MLAPTTYSQIIPKTQNSLLWEMAKESAQAYNRAIQGWVDGESFKKIGLKRPDQIRNFICAQSYQAATERGAVAIRSYFAALKSFKKNPKKFNGQPRPPRNNKFLSCVEFKKDAIRFKNGNLFLSSSKRDNPIKIRWDIKISLPRFASITMKDGEWVLNAVLDKPATEKIEATDKVLAVDLGVKRIAATHDGESSILYSGKPILALNRLYEKKKGVLYQVQAKFKKGTRKHKKLRRGLRAQIRKIKNTKKDFLHKTSRAIVNEAKTRQASTIVFGDCSSIHQSPNLGKQNNQRVATNPEQILRKYVTYKFERIGGTTKVVPEHYSSQTCPVCGLRHKPSNRTFKCPGCHFEYDRDSLGALNIHVSFGEDGCKPAFSGRSGGLTPPIGKRFYPSGYKTLPRLSANKLASKLVCQLEEPTALKR